MCAGRALSRRSPGQQSSRSCFPGWAWALTAVPLQAAEPEYDEPDVILVIKEKAFHMVKGKYRGGKFPAPGLLLDRW